MRYSKNFQMIKFYVFKGILKKINKASKLHKIFKTTLEVFFMNIYKSIIINIL